MVSSRKEINMRLIQINELETLNSQNITESMFVPVQESGYKKRAKKLKIKEYVDNAASSSRIKSHIEITAGPGVKFGKYENGEVIRSQGMTLEELLKDALSSPAEKKVVIDFSDKLPKYTPPYSTDPNSPVSAFQDVTIKYNRSEYGDIDMLDFGVGFLLSGQSDIKWMNATVDGEEIKVEGVYEFLTNEGLQIDRNGYIDVKVKYRNEDGVMFYSNSIRYEMVGTIDPVIGTNFRSEPPDSSEYDKAEFSEYIPIIPGVDIESRVSAGANIFFCPSAFKPKKIMTSEGEDITDSVKRQSGSSASYSIEFAVTPSFNIIFKQ